LKYCNSTVYILRRLQNRSTPRILESFHFCLSQPSSLRLTIGLAWEKVWVLATRGKPYITKFISKFHMYCYQQLSSDIQARWTCWSFHPLNLILFMKASGPKWKKAIKLEFTWYSLLVACAGTHCQLGHSASKNGKRICIKNQVTPL
jgi:hypothetical protein